VVLAVLSAVGGWIGLPFQHGGHLLERWLAPVFAPDPVASALGETAHAAVEHAENVSLEIALMALSVAIAAVGIAFAFRAYLQKPDLATRLQQRLAFLHRVWLNKYWVDELYDRIVVSPIHRASERLWQFWDVKVVDGAVNGVAYVFEGASAVLRLAQTGFVGTYALFIAVGAAALVLHFLRRG